MLRRKIGPKAGYRSSQDLSQLCMDVSHISRDSHVAQFNATTHRQSKSKRIRSPEQMQARHDLEINLPKKSKIESSDDETINTTLRSKKPQDSPDLVERLGKAEGNHRNSHEFNFSNLQSVSAATQQEENARDTPPRLSYQGVHKSSLMTEARKKKETMRVNEAKSRSYRQTNTQIF